MDRCICHLCGESVPCNDRVAVVAMRMGWRRDESGLPFGGLTSRVFVCAECQSITDFMRAHKSAGLASNFGRV